MRSIRITGTNAPREIAICSMRSFKHRYVREAFGHKIHWAKRVKFLTLLLNVVDIRVDVALMSLPSLLSHFTSRTNMTFSELPYNELRITDSEHFGSWWLISACGYYDWQSTWHVWNLRHVRIAQTRERERERERKREIAIAYDLTMTLKMWYCLFFI